MRCSRTADTDRQLSEAEYDRADELPDGGGRLLAVSDLHVTHPENRGIVECIATRARLPTG